MSYLRTFLVNCFQLLHSGIATIIPNNNINYGISIILFTLIVRLLLLPLNIKQTKSQAKMQEIQPELKKVQDKYKNDPQKQQQEVMKLYKEYGANPMSGCLPLLIQMPVLFAMYYVYYNLTGISGVHFLWLSDLSKRDVTYILPVLSTATTFISTRMITPPDDNPQAKQMAQMSTFMALFTGVMSINFRSALVLYWVTNNLTQIGQTYVMKRLGLIGKPKTSSDSEDNLNSKKQLYKEISTDEVRTKKNDNKKRK